MPSARLDHVVVAAATLDAGAEWVADRLGVAPVAGGRHPRMGTHNRVLSLGSAYLEVIAVDPEAPAPTRPRWFDLDNPWLREVLQSAPRIVTWAVNTPDLRGLGLPAEIWGETVPMSRGEYEWLITIPPDGRLPAAGAAPTVLQWTGAMPIATMPDSGCRFAGLQVTHPNAGWLTALLRDHGLDPGGVDWVESGRGAEILLSVATAAGTVVLG